MTDATTADFFTQFAGDAWQHHARHLAEHVRQRACRQAHVDSAAEEPPPNFAWGHRHRRPPFGGPRGPFFGGLFGGGFGRGPRMRRGDVRAAILALLQEQSRNGYQIIQEIERRSSGLWKPSAGSVYPALQQLEDEGLIEAADEGGRREWRLTAAGRTYAADHQDELAAPWASVADSVDEEFRSIREILVAVAAATVQVVQAGSPQQIARARGLLNDVRKGLYRILAEEEGDPEGDSKPAAST